MKLSDHFSFEELTTTSHADLRVRNRAEALDCERSLRALCQTILEPLRAEIGRPLVVHSGFRGPTLNARVGGSPNSQHMRGEAVDWSLPGKETEEEIVALFRRALDILRAKAIPFGQMILEQDGRRGFDVARWIHTSLGEPFRPVAKCRQILTMVNGNYAIYQGPPA